jgi:hypothetical protein
MPLESMPLPHLLLTDRKEERNEERKKERKRERRK